jgi:ATP-binding cassette subfamily B protein
LKSNFKSELKTVLKVAKWEYVLKLFVSIMIRGILLAIPVLFSIAVNAVTKGDKDLFLTMTILSIILAGVYRFFEGYNQVAYYKLYNKIYNYYNEQAITVTKDNSLFSLSRFSPGQYTNMVISDVDIISGFFTAAVIRVVQLIEFLFIFIYFLFLDLYVFLFTLVITVIMIIISLKLGKKVQVRNEKRKSRLDKLTSSSYDYIGGIKEIKSFNIFDKIYPSIKEKRTEYLKANADYNIYFNFSNSMILYVFELIRLMAVIYIGVKAINGEAEVGTILVIYNYYQKIIDNFLIVLTLNVEYRNVNVSLERFNHIREYSSATNKRISLKKEETKGSIEFKNVLYGFRDNPTLNNISFTIPSNSITVLTGGDETAQTGVFDLLLRLNRQHEGSILLDNNKIGDINDKSYYDLVSSVRRQTMFFDVSIKDNFTMINSDFDKIVEICKLVGLDEEIMKLENGYDTIVDENTPLSMSTKKLLVIVRMLLSESKILLIDDVINMLDEKHEKRLMDLLMEMKKDHTILIITHSKRIVSRADKVLEITNNGVLEIGK